MSTELLNKLKERFPDEAIREREGADGKVFKYIPTIFVANRLDDVFPLAWNWEVIDSKVHQTRKLRKRVTWDKSVQPWKKSETEVEADIFNLAVLGRLTLALPGGEKVFRDAWGGCELFKGGQAGDDYKIADSNAFKKAAYKFGIGAHIGLDVAEAEELNEATYEKNRDSKQKTYSKPKKGGSVQSENPFLK
jgi:hypothetical protein